MFGGIFAKAEWRHIALVLHSQALNRWKRSRFASPCASVRNSKTARAQTFNSRREFKYVFMTRFPFQCLPILRGLHTPDVGACGIPLSDLLIPLIPDGIAQHFLYRGKCSREGLAAYFLHYWSRAFPLTGTARFQSLPLIGAGRRCLRTTSFSHLVWIRVHWRYATRPAQRDVPPHH